MKAHLYFAALSWTCLAVVASADDVESMSVDGHLEMAGASTSNSSLTYFVGPDGVPVLTNRKAHYRRQADYVEVRLELKEIFVPNRFTSFRSALEYPPETIEEVIDTYAKHHQLDRDLLCALIHVESDFNPHAVSRSGARGLMQLMPGTASALGVSRVYDPAQNVAGGSQYLAALLNEFRNDERLALAAYNAGPGAVKKYKGVPPYPETERYVNAVLAKRSQYRSGTLRPAYRPSGRAPRDVYLPDAVDAVFTVHFNSGLTQFAEAVHDKGEYYELEFERRTYMVRKELVARVERRT